MKTAIDVENRREGELIKLGIADPETRALVKIMGVLAELPTKERKRRVLKFVVETLTEFDSDGNGSA